MFVGKNYYSLPAGMPRVFDNSTLNSQEGLNEGEFFYRSLIENLPLGITRAASGEAGQILMANSAFCSIFGLDGKVDIGKMKMADLFWEKKDLENFSELLIKKRQISGVEYKLKRKDGKAVWTSISAGVVQDNQGGLLFDCAVEDITRRKQLEKKLFKRNALLNNISEHAPGLIYQFRYYPEGRSCFTYASEGIRELFEVAPKEVRNNAAAVFQRIHGDDYDRVMGSIRASFYSLQPWKEMFRVVLPRSGERWLDGRSIPVKLDDGSVLWHGFIFDVTEYKKEEEKIRSENNELSALYSLSTHMRKAKTTSELLPLVLEKAQSLLEADDGAITLLTPDGNHFTISTASGNWKGGEGQTFSVENGLNGKVLSTRQTFVSSDYGSEPRALFTFDSAEKIGPVIIVPLLSREELVGSLAVSRRRSSGRDPFDDTAVQLLGTIGELAGSALSRQRLYEDAKRRLGQTQALRNIDMAITGSHDLRVTYNVILDEITRQSNIDAAAILRLEPHSMALKYESSRGFYKTDLTGLQLRLGEGFAGKTVMEKKAYFIGDLNEADVQNFQGNCFLEEGFCSYYAVPLIVKGQVLGVLEVLHRGKTDASEQCLSFLDTLAGQTAIAIDNATLFNDLERANIQLIQSYDSTIEGWAYALDLRDEATEGHSQRVAKMTLDLAAQMGVKEENLAYMRRGALLHDIGKMGIPDSILLKPGKLTGEEWDIMRKHPLFAYQMLSSVEYLRPALDIPYCHHEKWDGTGYPRGLKGKEIPLAARIFAVVDIYDALTSDRPYRHAWSKEEALDYIRKQSGKHFDPKVVELFLKKVASDWK